MYDSDEAAVYLLEVFMQHSRRDQLDQVPPVDQVLSDAYPGMPHDQEVLVLETLHAWVQGQRARRGRFIRPTG